MLRTGCDLVDGRVEKVGEVTRLRDYLLHTIKSHSTQRQKVPHLAHLGHLRAPLGQLRGLSTLRVPARKNLQVSRWSPHTLTSGPHTTRGT